MVLFRPSEIEETFKHRRVLMLRKTLVMVIAAQLIARLQL